MSPHRENIKFKGFMAGIFEAHQRVDIGEPVIKEGIVGN